MPVDPNLYLKVARELIEFKQRNQVRLAVVPGGGNIFRGRQVTGFEFDRSVADYMGMLATVINGEGLAEALNHQGAPARNMTAIPMNLVSEPFIRKKALSHLRKDIMVVLSGGLGRPYVTTDTAIAHLACELNCNVVLKATNVDGIYDKDPKKFPDAVRFTHLTFQEALERRLNVMDSTAFAFCQDNHKPILVFHIDDLPYLDISKRENSVGTWVGL
jgi:uridylate kinase